MVRENSVWTLAVVILFIAIVLPGLNVAGNDNTALFTVENESVTVDYGNETAVDPPHEAFSFEPNATVFNATGAELVNGTDYEWRPVNGTINWINTANTSDGDTATVTYQFTGRTRSTRDVNTIMAVLSEFWPWLILIAGVGATLRYGSPW